MIKQYKDQPDAMHAAEKLANEGNKPVFLVQNLDMRGRPWEVHLERPSDNPSTEIMPTK